MLTVEQLAIVKNAIDEDSTLSMKPNTPDAAYEIAELLNAIASPAFYVWKTSVSPNELREAVSTAISEVDNLTASKRETLLWFIENTLNASKLSVRTSMNDLTGNQNGLKAALIAAAKRKCSRLEKLLAIGTGSEAVPSTMTYEGYISYQEVLQARAL